ncbi:lysophospholipase [Pseudooceanicola sp. 216_PA32_1]|uniref:Lysophospholipase n=1 Tax=Pseudooceanicola pacificus TaxID=2676438 RepID=A0A844WDA9_9RHOB|nr:GDSL-type esterase/lipase family protein [Pseudooceanicola pacificus]MWB78362.1 lysophospholipase [Pseudooceanicola pacificus]
MYKAPEDIRTNRFEDDVTGLLTRLSRGGLPERPIAFYGSSSFRLWPSVNRDLGSLDIVNLGFGGGTYLSGLHYFDTLLAPLNPAKVVLYFGENDIANDGLTGASAFANFLKLQDRIGTAFPQAQLFVLETKQSPTRWIYADEVDTLNALQREWCEGRPDARFVATSAGLIGENGRPIGRYYEGDFIHLNASGYAIWADILRREPGLLT